MKTSESLAISQKADIVAGRNVENGFSSSFTTIMTTEIDKTADPSAEQLNTKKEKSSKFSKAKNLGKALGVTILGVLGAQNADAQFIETGSIPDQHKTTVTLNAHDKGFAYWNEISPYQQHFNIIKVNTPNPHDWRDDHEVVFSSSNNQITINEIGEAVIRSTTDINGNEARQWIFDNLTPGTYVIQPRIWADDDLRSPVFFVNVDNDGNQQIFDGEAIDSNPLAYYWDNKIFGNDIALNTVEHQGGQVHISAYVPPIVDPVSGELGTNMNPLEQSGDYIKVKWANGNTTTVNKEDLSYNVENNTIDFSIPDQGVKVVSLQSQHAIVAPFAVNDTFMGVEDMNQNDFAMLNPVKSGQDIVFKTSHDLEVALYDLTGRLVLKESISPAKTSISQQLNPGIYVLTAINPHNAQAKPIRKKLIVQ